MMHYNRKLLLLLIFVAIARLSLKMFGMWQMQTMRFEGHLIWLSNIGITLHFAIGPLFYFYLHSRVNSNFRINYKQYLHFGIFIFFTLLLLFYQKTFWDLGLLRFHYLHILIYYLLGLRCYLLATSIDLGLAEELRYLKISLLGIAILMIGYAPIMYAYIDVVDTILIYIAASYFIYLMIKHKGQFHSIKKYKGSNLSTEKSEQIKTKLEEVMRDEHLFLRSGISLQVLANILEVNSKHLSQCINEKFNKGFTDYINSLRVDIIKDKLLNPLYSHFKIASIAYDCGFESISVFNTAFKKFTGVTPREFQQT